MIFIRLSHCLQSQVLRLKVMGQEDIVQDVVQLVLATVSAQLWVLVPDVGHFLDSSLKVSLLSNRHFDVFH